MERQLEGLLHPIFADIKDPAFQGIHEMAFISLDRDPEDWSVQGSPIVFSDAEEVRKTPKALQNALLLKGLSDTPARVDAPAPMPVLAPAHTQVPAHADAHMGEQAHPPAQVHAPVQADTPTPAPAPVREVFGPQVNTTPPPGGFYVGEPPKAAPPSGKKEIILTDAHDPWAVKSTPTGQGSQRVRKVVRASDGQVVKK